MMSNPHCVSSLRLPILTSSNDRQYFNPVVVSPDDLGPQTLYDHKIFSEEVPGFVDPIDSRADDVRNNTQQKHKMYISAFLHDGAAVSWARFPHKQDGFQSQGYVVVSVRKNISNAAMVVMGPSEEYP